MRVRLFAWLPCLLLVACASTGPDYEPADSKRDDGYRETQLSDARYRVSFAAGARDQAVARDYAVLRAAELTLQKGYDWFEVASRDATVSGDDNSAGASVAMSRQTTTDCGLLGCSTTSVTRPSAGMNVDTGAGRDRTVATVEFVMGKGEVPEGADYYNAQAVAERIRAERL